jgi:putative membrane-bound dehydrogenase-like protein
MKRLTLCALLLAICTGFASAGSLLADDRFDAQWIWYPAGHPEQNAPVGKVWFRREVRADEPSTGAARVMCDDHFVLWVNGIKIGEGDASRLYRFNLNDIVDRGPNVICVEAENRGGRAGLFVDGEVRSQGGHKLPFDTGAEWLATTVAPNGTAWLKPKFDTRDWKPVKVLGPHEKSPWNKIALKETYLDRFDVPKGFELSRVAEPKMVGSLVAMTWGNRGRLLVSRERGPILCLIDDNHDGVYDRVVEYTTEIKNCQGLCTVGDDLYAVGQGPKGVGVYCLPDKDHDDKADEVNLVVHSQGGMGDHGPHDVIFGPDGWLYHNMGNHAHIREKQPEPTSPCRDYDEDYLLVPKFEDAGGHAVGIKAPGGTIYRFPPDGKHWWMETSGFRNEYDFAFNAAGEMFTFDADMEWDVGAYWYRPIRVNHCIAGAEFGWRSGAAKWPAYYFDSLPGTVDVGRGSPTGIVFYDHNQFPKKYHGSLIMGDWSMGRILVAHLQKSGASYTGTWETLLSGNPLNITDLEVDRDGSIVFVTGGRATEGGVYRLRYKDGSSKPADAANVAELLKLPQIESAWAREIAARVKASAGPRWQSSLASAVRGRNPAVALRALTLLCQLGPKPDLRLLLEASNARDADVRAFATHLLGFESGLEVRAALVRLLDDPDRTVQRRACEAFIHSGQQPPVDSILKLLASEDRWLRFSARLALERIPQDRWLERALGSSDPHVVMEALLASYRLDRRGAAPRILAETAKILAQAAAKLSPEIKMAALRLTQLALLQGTRNAASDQIGHDLLGAFPTGQTEFDAETARILAVLNLAPAAEKIMHLVETSPDHGVQLHYALTLRYLNDGWTFDLKRRLLAWYEGTRDWEGGNSLTGYVSNIVGATSERFTPSDRKYFVQHAAEFPAAAALLVRICKPEEIADYEKILGSLLSDTSAKNGRGREELVAAAIQSLGKSDSPTSRAMLRRLYEDYPDRRETIARAVAAKPLDDDLPLLVRTLQFADSTTMQLCLEALDEIPRRPDQADAYRTLIQAALKLGTDGGRGAISVLKDWTKADAEAGRDLDKAIAFYQKWYREKFPSAPAPELPKSETAKPKYTFNQILDLVEHDAQGLASNGRAVFTKARCVRCHRFQSEGESLGPDLTSVRRRFQRKEIVESIIYPSQVISDQYRMVQVVTREGQVYVGMPVPGISKNDKLVLLMSDATRLEIPKSRIEEQNPSRISVMPAGLLDQLSLREIADLFAFLETSKLNAPTAQAAAGK